MLVDLIGGSPLTGSVLLRTPNPSFPLQAKKSISDAKPPGGEAVVTHVLIYTALVAMFLFVLLCDWTPGTICPGVPEDSRKPLLRRMLEILSRTCHKHAANLLEIASQQQPSQISGK